jgi:hypothetical protein
VLTDATGSTRFLAAIFDLTGSVDFNWLAIIN